MFFYVYMSAYVFVAIVSLLVFYSRRNLEPIRSREWRPVIGSSTLGTILQIFLCVFTELSLDSSNANLSCGLVTWPSSLLIPSLFSPFFVRSFMLYYKFRLAKVRENGITQTDASWLYKYRFVSHRSVWIFVSVFFLAISILINGILVRQIPPEQYTLASGCGGSWTYLPLAESIETILVLGILSVFLFQVNDNYQFKHELNALLFLSTPWIILLAIQNVSPLLFPADLPITIWAILLVGSCFVVSVWFPLALTFHPYYALRKDSPDQTSIDLASVSEKVPLSEVGSNTLLEAILRDPDLLAAFKNYACQSFCVENIFFVKDAQKYSLMFDEASRRNEALRMFDIYCQPTGAMEINVDQTIINAISASIKNKSFPPNLFEDAEKKITLVLKQDVLAKWRTTSEFSKVMKLSSLADFIDFSDQPSSKQQHQTLRKVGSASPPKMAQVSLKLEETSSSQRSSAAMVEYV